MCLAVSLAVKKGGASRPRSAKHKTQSEAFSCPQRFPLGFASAGSGLVEPPPRPVGCASSPFPPWFGRCDRSIGGAKTRLLSRALSTYLYKLRDFILYFPGLCTMQIFYAIVVEGLPDSFSRACGATSLCCSQKPDFKGACIIYLTM